MGALPPLSVIDRASVSIARERVRQVASEAGFGREGIEELALLVSELAQNQLDHARSTGVISVEPIRRAGVSGVEIVASDRGPGIAHPADAVAGMVVPRGLGAGLPSVRRLASELDLAVVQGEGTQIRARRFVGPAPRHPEVACLGRGMVDPCGDRSWVRRSDGALLLAVLDGVGHGAPAREAADRGVAALEASSSTDPVALLHAIDDACGGTRGVAASIARWNVQARTVEVAGVGNVAAHLYAPGQAPRALLPTPGVLGVRSPRRVTAARTFPLADRSVLIVHTDGLSSRTVMDPAGEGLFRSPVRVADLLMSRGAKAHDDVLVLVVR
ncbi:MAG: SpoIIE family protein phosphatase [Alphaproteobacteria bacterium]|nr:SpoIIE family protein phosphatase [Alphaproteobacteria bacterium]